MNNAMQLYKTVRNDVELNIMAMSLCFLAATVTMSGIAHLSLKSQKF